MRFLSLSLLLAFFATNVTAELPSWSELAERARWAANAHNVQSWQLLPVEGRPDQRGLTLNSARLLPQTDPTSRQLTISLGAFLSVLEDEATLRGAQISWEPRSDGSAGALVSIKEGPLVLQSQEKIDALSSPTVKYRTTGLSLDAEVRAGHEARSNSTVRVHWLASEAEVRQAKRWAQAAYDLEMDLPRTRNESIAYTRIGVGARQSRPFGITLLPNFPKGELFWVEAFAGILPQSPLEYATSAKGLLAQALGPVEQILVITSLGNGVRERLETGRMVQRLWIDVRSRGGELLPLSQGLQEFPEMAQLYAEALQQWANPGETVQMVLALFRPGPGEFLRSPRLPVSEIAP